MVACAFDWHTFDDFRWLWTAISSNCLRIFPVWKATTAKRMEIDQYCQRQFCHYVLFSDVYITLILLGIPRSTITIQWGNIDFTVRGIAIFKLVRENIIVKTSIEHGQLWPLPLWPLRHVAQLGNLRQISQKEAFPMNSTICVEWAVIISVVVWHKSIHFWRRYAAKKMFFFYISCPATVVWFG